MQQFYTVMRQIIWRSDATTIRLVLAVSSLLWALSVWTAPDAMSRPPYMALNMVVGGAVHPWTWGGLFFLHFLGVMWRLTDPKERVVCGLVINSYGLFLWLSVTLVISWRLGFHVGQSTDWALCLSSAWALYRTGAKNELVTP